MSPGWNTLEKNSSVALQLMWTPLILYPAASGSALPSLLTIKMLKWEHPNYKNNTASGAGTISIEVLKHDWGELFGHESIISSFTSAKRMIYQSTQNVAVMIIFRKIVEENVQLLYGFCPMWTWSSSMMTPWEMQEGTPDPTRSFLTSFMSLTPSTSEIMCIYSFSVAYENVYPFCAFFMMLFMPWFYLMDL